MTFELYHRVVLAKDLFEHGLRAGDVGTVVEHYRVRDAIPEGYELEFFAEVYPPLKQTAKECKALQDLLGTLQDVYAGTARLRRYSALLRKQGGDGTLPQSLVALRKNQLGVARDVRRSFRAAWPAFVAAIGAARKLVA